MLAVVSAERTPAACLWPAALGIDVACENEAQFGADPLSGEPRAISDVFRRGEFDMHLVQLFIPATPRASIDFEDFVASVQREMTERFGGATAYLSSPAKGLWSKDRNIEEDEIVVIEVMTDDLDRNWWHQYRRKLEHMLNQDELLVRALPVEKL